jgi:hypothetical protein
LVGSGRQQQRNKRTTTNAEVAGVGGVVYINDVEANSMHCPQHHDNIKALGGINNVMLQASDIISQAIGRAQPSPAAAAIVTPAPSAATGPLLLLVMVMMMATPLHPFTSIW